LLQKLEPRVADDRKSSHDVSLAELVRRVQLGDRHSFAVMLMRTENFVRALLRRWRFQKADIDDLAADIYMDFWKNARRIREPDRFIPWLITVCKRTAREARRKQQQEAMAVSTEARERQSPTRPTAVPHRTWTSNTSCRSCPRTVRTYST